MQYERKPLLGQILVEQGYILPEQLELALKEQTVTNLRIGEMCIRDRPRSHKRFRNWKNTTLCGRYERCL